MRNTNHWRQAQEIEAQLLSSLSNWSEGDGKLPAETELAAEFGVSRVTVREALSSLERRGLILRRQGLGTFVNRRAANIQTRLEESIEFGEMLRASGHEAGMQVLEFGRAAASEETARRLLIRPGAELVHIHKLFTADARPVIDCTNLIPLDLAPAGERDNLLSIIDPTLSIYSILHRWFQQSVDYQISDAEACSAGDDLAARLDCNPQAPLFRIGEVGYTLRQRPVFTGDAYFVPGFIRFRLVRKPIFSIP